MKSKTNQTLEKFNFIPEFMKFDIKRKSELITIIYLIMIISVSQIDFKN